MTLFNDEYILKTYIESERREAAKAAAEAAANAATAAVTKRAAAEAIEKSKRIAQKMFQKGKAVEYIAYCLDASVEEIEQWLEPAKTE